MAATTMRQYLGHGLLVLAVAALVVAMLPVAVPVILAARFLFLIGLGALLVGFLVSPKLRHWLAAEVRDDAPVLAGLALPGDVLLDQGHSWARPHQGDFRVGVDDLVQRVLGPIEAVDLPAAGRVVQRGEALFRLRRGGRSIAVKSPVEGTVAGANQAVSERPKLINQSPYSLGWVVQVRPTDLDRSRALLRRGEAARAWLHREVERLKMILIVPSLQPVQATMLDGGALVPDLHRQIDDPTWEKIKSGFFA
jgi:glycine cleavage system H protein